jgi:aryl-alcohol dehydrogenase-like predicted oxidoreductase
MAATYPPAASSGVFSIGGGLPVTRLGFGAMRITGPGIWGDPPDRDEAIAVLRRAAELGVDFIDTADSYGPAVSEDLIRAALHPYDGIAIATKGGFLRTGPGKWHALGKPEYLRQCVEMSLRRLGVDTIDLYQLHRIDPEIPLADQVGELDAMRREGKIRYLGLSEVSVPQIGEARLTAPIASVQNLYIASGRLAEAHGPLATLAKQTGAAPVQLALAWLLQRSGVMLPIPGTGSAEHLEENVGAALIELTDAQYAELSALG